jgi:hypothetical protein
VLQKNFNREKCSEFGGGVLILHADPEIGPYPAVPGALFTGLGLAHRIACLA